MGKYHKSTALRDTIQRMFENLNQQLDVFLQHYGPQIEPVLCRFTI
jgi:hypothetical protein